MIIELSADEGMAAVSVAAMQMFRTIRKGRSVDHGGSSDRTLTERWGNIIHGNMAEIAVSRALYRPWTPGGAKISRGEIGGDIEVRATEHKNGHLLIYENDLDDKWVVLAVGHWPTFRIVGAILAGEAKRIIPINTDAKPPCYWVPQQSLSDWRHLISGEQHDPDRA